MKRGNPITIIFLLTMMSLNSNVNAQEILEWRGIERSGHYQSTNLLKKWPDEGPKLILSIDTLASSYSSVVVKDKVMFTTSVDGDLEMLTAINMNGKQKWNTIYGKSFNKTFSPARCTPTIENESAYVISGLGDIASINIKNGKINWSLDGLNKFEGKTGLWGVAESPLIVDEKLIFTPGGDLTTMVALNKETGETVWMTESLKDQTAYCSPILVQRGDYKLIITVIGNYVIAVNAEDGAFLWKFKYTDVDSPKSGGDINPVTPLIKGNEIFVTSGYNHVGIMLKMSNDLKSVELKWKTADLDVHHGGVVESNGFIYGSNFTNIINGHWLCIDWNTGELKYDYEWNGKGSIIFSDGMLICYDERKGNVALVEANPKEFKIISSFKVEHGNGPHWSHPSIFQDLLFMRHGKSLLVYDIGGK